MLNAHHAVKSVATKIVLQTGVKKSTAHLNSTIQKTAAGHHHVEQDNIYDL